MDSNDAHPDRARFRIRAAHGLLAAYWLGIFTLTHLPQLPRVAGVPNVDKVAHLLAYGLLALLYFTARSMARPLMWRDYLIGMLVFAVYGVADELLQIPVGRTCDAMDWVA